MKNLLLCIGMLILCSSAMAQPPGAFNYQGIARDGAGSPLVNKNISLRTAIKMGALPGTEVYKETHNVQTNKLGLFTVEIGHGTSQIGVFNTIDWGAADHYIQIEMDPSGGTNYTLLGESQLLSVPYALYAGNGGDPVWNVNSSGINYNIGNVGIGTNSPGQKLSIEGNDDIGNSRNYLSLNNQSTSNRSIVFMELTAGQPNSATSLQHISESYDFEGDKYTDFGVLASSGSGLILRADGDAGLIKFLAGGTPLSTTERMRITNAGKVGIGTENPRNLLSIDGDVDTGDERFFVSVNNRSLSNRSFSAAKFSAGGGSSITSFGHNSETYDYDNFSTADFGGISSSGAGIYLTAFRADGIIKFMTSVNGGGFPLERMRIESDGNLGVGTSDPASRVQVAGGDVYIEDINNGVIMKSPNGNCWRMTINNDGSVKTTAIACPQ